MEGGGWGLAATPRSLRATSFLLDAERNDVSGGSEVVFLIGGEQLVTALALQMGSQRC